MDEFLLYYSFYRTQQWQIPKIALEIINESLHQRESLFKTAIRTELLVSSEDIEGYHEVKFYRDRLQAVIYTLEKDEITFLLFKVGQGEQLRVRIDDVRNILRQLTLLLDAN